MTIVLVNDKNARHILYRRCARIWGVESQIKMIIEEIGEFLIVAMEYQKLSTNDLLDEIADNQIMFEQAPLLYGFSAQEIQECTKRMLSTKRIVDYTTIIRAVGYFLKTAMQWGRVYKDIQPVQLLDVIVETQIQFDRAVQYYGFSEELVQARKEQKLQRLLERYIESTQKAEIDVDFFFQER